MKVVGERIRMLRKERHWVQDELAKRVNVSSQVISNWERGYTNIDHDDILRLAKIFDVSSDYILGNTEDRSHVVNNSAQTTIRLLKEEAAKMGLSPSDPVFKKMLSDAFELLRLARGKDME